MAGQGSQTECPPVTTTYYLTVVYTNNTSQTQAITINVAPAPVNAPIIELFTVTPPQIQPGQCVNIQWDVQGQRAADQHHARRHDLVGRGAGAGHMQDCPPGSGSIGYTLMRGPGRPDHGAAEREHRRAADGRAADSGAADGGAANGGAADGGPTDGGPAHGGAADSGAANGGATPGYRGQELGANGLQQRAKCDGVSR